MNPSSALRLVLLASFRDGSLLFMRIAAPVRGPVLLIACRVGLAASFLIPALGILWGHLFLAEPVGWRTGVGALAVVLGAALVSGFSPGVMMTKRVPNNG